uniref:Transmembrane protein n=1 Tax=Steinernema glaseri TaxID=37863 RepID=A0A1I8AI30_9BILA
MDANYPENRSPENLKRPVEVDMLEGSCAYRRFFNSSFRPLLDYFSLPPYISGKKDPDDFYPRCECSSRGRGQHCKPSKAVNQDKKLLETGDELFDITGLESVRYLLSTHGLYPLRYGGFSFGANVSYVPEGYGVHKKEFARLLAVRHVSKVWYDNYAYHSPSIFLNALNNEVLRSALRARLNGSGNPGSFGITVVNHPFEDTEQMITPEKILQGNDILIVVFLVVALAFVPSSFVFGIVHERSTLSTHLEYLAGMPGPLYWVSNFLWHLLNYGLPALMSIVIIRLFDIPMYVASENFLGIVLLILLYGWACTPLVHLLSAFFDDASTAFLAVLALGDPEKVTSIFKFPFINSNLIVLAAEGLLAFVLVIAFDVLRHRRR